MISSGRGSITLERDDYIEVGHNLYKGQYYCREGTNMIEEWGYGHMGGMLLWRK